MSLPCTIFQPFDSRQPEGVLRSHARRVAVGLYGRGVADCAHVGLSPDANGVALVAQMRGWNEGIRGRKTLYPVLQEEIGGFARVIL